MNNKMRKVRAKKHLGQHFLNDFNVAQKIADSLYYEADKKVLEIGPGMGVLTQFLLQKENEVFVVEIDKESVVYIKTHFPQLNNHIIEGDFLKLPLNEIFKKPFFNLSRFVT